jgi:hypothetical protein
MLQEVPWNTLSCQKNRATVTVEQSSVVSYVVPERRNVMKYSHVVQAVEGTC